jgi:hypothetical protein
MPIDANILLQGRVADAGGAFGRGLETGQAINQAPFRNSLLEAQSRQASSEADKTLKINQLRDMAQDAMMVRPLIESGNVEAAKAMVADRIGKINQRKGDAVHSQRFLAQLEAGDTQGALREIDTVLNAATKLGVLGSGQGTRAFAPIPMRDAAGNFTGYSVPTVDASGNAIMRPISGSEGAISPLDIAREREQIGVQGYGQKRAIEAQTAGDIAGGAERGKLDVQSEIRPDLEASIEEAKTTARTKVEKAASITKAISEEQEVGRILDLAAPLLKDATESLAGVALDKAGKLVGLSTKGSQAAAKLKTLEGALVLKMPRMEGPQSNADRDLYVQMAAQIGDATVPAEERQAAVDILRELNRRYSGQQAPNGPVPPAPGGSIPAGATATNPQTGQKIIFRGGQWQPL